MNVGFDYGTSNCAMAKVEHGIAQLIPLVGDSCFLPSTLYALARPFIAESIAQQMVEGEQKEQFITSRKSILSQSRAAKIEYQLTHVDQEIYVGQEAIEQYILSPSEGYFVKSPKSFLGASGLKQPSVNFFEDVVATMMLNIKRRAEYHLAEPITQAVIGRPVNFQGINTEQSNQQAQSILFNAAQRIGILDVEFLYEPLAAGFDYEMQLDTDKKVLVVDIGGGTTDCSMVLMGPSHRNKLSRREDFLGHSGERIGGNDFDIKLTQHGLMPHFGSVSFLKDGLPMPLMPFVNASTINDLGAQNEFYDTKTGLLLERLMRDSQQPELLQRLIKLRNERHNFALVREAELAKIMLSEQGQHRIALDFIEQYFWADLTQKQLQEASSALLTKVVTLVKEACGQSSTLPDLVYLTGGSAKSPLIRQALKSYFGKGVALVDGDHFGSVASGLAVWAERIFR